MQTTKNDLNSYQPKLSLQDIANFLEISVQAVHKQLKLKGISTPKWGNKGYIDHDIARTFLNYPFEKKSIAVQIVKGGVGKTTTLINIANCANAYGARVLLIDLDPQGNLTDFHGLDVDNIPVLVDILKDERPIEESITNIRSGLDIIPSRIENVILDNTIINNRLPLDGFFSNLLSSVKENYDFIFIDCPPNLGQSVTAATLYSDLILAPLNPDKFSLKGLKILQNELVKLNKNYKKNIDYKVFLNRHNNKTVLSEITLRSLLQSDELEGKILSTLIPNTQEISNMISAEQSLFSSLKKSSIREDYNNLTRELLNIHPHIAQNQPQHEQKAFKKYAASL